MRNLVEEIINKDLNKANDILKEALNQKALFMLEEIKKMLAAEQFTSLEESQKISRRDALRAAINYHRGEFGVPAVAGTLGGAAIAPLYGMPSSIGAAMGAATVATAHGNTIRKTYKKIRNKEWSDADKLVSDAKKYKKLPLRKKIKAKVNSFLGHPNSLDEEHDPHKEMRKKGYRLHMQSVQKHDAERIAKNVGGIVVPPIEGSKETIDSGTGSAIFHKGNFSVYVKEDTLPKKYD